MGIFTNDYEKVGQQVGSRLIQTQDMAPQTWGAVFSSSYDVHKGEDVTFGVAKLKQNEVFKNLDLLKEYDPRLDPFNFVQDYATAGGSYGPGAPFTWPTQQDWTRFMPQNFPLAEQGGLHYQPWLAGGGGMGGGAGGFAGPDLPPGYNTGGGLIAGGPGPIDTNIWGDTATAVPPITTGAGPGGFEGDTYNSEGVMVDRQGNPVDRPAWGIQFPSGGQGFKVVPSYSLPYYQTEEGKLDAWAPTADPSGEGWGDFDYGAVDASQADPVEYGLGDWL